MSFPNTRLSLIQRLAAQGAEEDWRQFVADYWVPVCRFAARNGRLTWTDSEDVAAETFAAVVNNRLLARWSGAPTAKLRTLLCTVVRNVLGNRIRVQQGRQAILRDSADEIRAQRWVLTDPEADGEGAADPLFADWAHSLLETAVQRLVEAYHQEGRGNYSRVLYGRLCEEMTAAEIAAALSLKSTDVDNYYRHAQKRLRQVLEDLLREHVQRYAPAGEEAAEFAAEWRHLGDFLVRSGDLEELIKRIRPAIDGSPSVSWDSVRDRVMGAQ